MEIVKKGQQPARTILREYTGLPQTSEMREVAYDCVRDSGCIPHHTHNGTDCGDFIVKRGLSYN